MVNASKGNKSYNGTIFPTGNNSEMFEKLTQLKQQWSYELTFFKLRLHFPNFKICEESNSKSIGHAPTIEYAA